MDKNINNIKITIFNSKSTSKFPISPYGDNTFEFRTIKTSFENLPYYFINHFHLNRCYNIKEPVIKKRLKRELKDYLCKQVQYIVLDIDDVFSKEDSEKIVEILKKENYYFFVLPSRSYGKGKYNLKGAILVEGSNNEESLKQFLLNINFLIKGLGKTDLSVIREATFQAPTLNNDFVIFHKGEIKKLPKIKKKIIKNEGYEDILFESIKYLNGLGFSVVQDKGDLLVFRHPNEKTPKGYFLFKNNPFILHHFDPSKSINFYKDISKLKSVKEFINRKNEEKLDKKLEKLSINAIKLKLKQKNTIFINERYVSLEIIEDFDVLKIKSPMGTGKSNLIAKYLNYFTKNNKRCLFITNRRSLAEDISKKYNINIYYDDYQNNGHLVTQFDSLWKYDIKNFDVVIIDEYISLLIHLLSNLTDKSVLNKMKLYKILTNKKFKLILLDAFLEIEPDFFKNRKKKYIFNEYKDNIELIQFTDKNTIISKILNEKEKITISVSNKNTGYLISELLKQKGKKVVFLNGDTSEEEKNKIFETFSQEATWDALVYTPTITVGISINCPNVKIHYHIDESQTIDVISSLQQLKRNRFAEKIIFFVKDIKKFKIIDKEILKNEYLYFLDESIYFSFDEFGNKIINNFGEFMFEIETFLNLLEVNHKKSFLKLLEHQFNTQSIKIVEEKTTLNLKEIKRQIKEKEQQKIELLINRLKNNDLTYNEEQKIKYYEKFLTFSSEDEKIQLLKIILKNKKDFNKMINHKLFLMKKEDLVNYLSILEKNGIGLEKIKLMKKMLYYKDNLKLKQRFVPKELNKELKSFLKELGYKYKYNSYYISDDYLKVIEKLIV